MFVLYIFLLALVPGFFCDSRLQVGDHAGGGAVFPFRGVQVVVGLFLLLLLLRGGGDGQQTLQLVDAVAVDPGNGCLIEAKVFWRQFPVELPYCFLPRDHLSVPPGRDVARHRQGGGVVLRETRRRGGHCRPSSSSSSSAAAAAVPRRRPLPRLSHRRRPALDLAILHLLPPERKRKNRRNVRFKNIVVGEIVPAPAFLHVAWFNYFIGGVALFYFR